MVNLEHPSQSENNEIDIEEGHEVENLIINENAKVQKDTIEYKIEKLEEKLAKAKSQKTKDHYSAGIKKLIEKRNDLVVANQKLAYYHVNKFYHYRIENMHGITIEDINQSAKEGLIKGIEKFSPSMGWKLPTYVSWWIRHSIRRFIKNNRRTVRMPIYIQDDIRKMMLTVNEFYIENDRLPHNNEIAKILEFSLKKIEKLMSFKSGQYLPNTRLSIPAPGLTQNSSPLMTLFEDTANWTNEKSGENKAKLLRDFREVAREKLYDIEIKKTSIEKANTLWHVFSNSFGLNEKGETLTLQDLAAIHGVSRERIRQIKNRALEYVKADKKLLEMLEEIKDVYSFF